MEKQLDIKNVELKEENKEDKKTELKTYNKNYYDKNKEILKQKASVKTECVLCGSKVNKSSMDTHLKSKLCIKRQKIKLKLIMMDDYIKNNQINMN